MQAGILTALATVGRAGTTWVAVLFYFFAMMCCCAAVCLHAVFVIPQSRDRRYYERQLARYVRRRGGVGISHNEIGIIADYAEVIEDGAVD